MGRGRKEVDEDKNRRRDERIKKDKRIKVVTRRIKKDKKRIKR